MEKIVKVSKTKTQTAFQYKVYLPREMVEEINLGDFALLKVESTKIAIYPAVFDVKKGVEK